MEKQTRRWLPVGSAFEVIIEVAMVSLTVCMKQVITMEEDPEDRG